MERECEREIWTERKREMMEREIGGRFVFMIVCSALRGDG